MRSRLFAILLLITSTAYATPDSYYSRSSFLQAPSATLGSGLYGYTNPGQAGMVDSPRLGFLWSSDGIDAGSIGQYGLYMVNRPLALSAVHLDIGEYTVTDYQVALGGGDKSHSFGIGYSWSSGDDTEVGREKILSFGSITRPNRYISVGLINTFSLNTRWNETVASLGLRPFGSDKLTVFADGALEYGMNIKNAPWSVGAIVQPISGFQMTGRFFENETFTLGFSFDLGRSVFSGQSSYDDSQKLTRYNYGVEFGGKRPTAISQLLESDKRMVPMSFTGRVDYTKYRYFDETIRFLNLLKAIKATADDERVSTIAVNLIGMKVAPELAWEIRNELAHCQSKGKRIIAFIESADMTQYHLASVADKIVIDPEGSIMLPGYVLGRTFFKGALEKLGLGFDEWRFFKYKSAAEALSRSDMSNADREQRQAYVDDWYELVRDEVCNSRSISHSTFDDIVNNTTWLPAQEAKDAGLVDTLARWSDFTKVAQALSGEKMRTLRVGRLATFENEDGQWGEKPKIAVVYAVGACAMESGIKARSLEKQLLRLSKDKTVKAIVLRVDSPGGDGMASDLVAEALKKCSKKKPVIISQGQVAASGGYWISMYGDKILAGANTITGSIGVIGGWLYDKGLSNKLGLTSDYVKRGEHAEAGFGVMLPYLGMRVPSRNLTVEERSLIESRIKGMYERFVGKVASGRNLSVDSVKAIAQGHWYSGNDGLENGLVDQIGGLMLAIDIAREQANLKSDEYRLIQWPQYKGLIDFGSRMSPVSSRLERSSLFQYLKLQSENNGNPLFMLLPGTYPEAE